MDCTECHSSKDARNSVKLVYSKADYFMLKYIRKLSHKRISLPVNVKNSIALYASFIRSSAWHCALHWKL